MLFVEGAVWSEASVGTSAPGTALALGRSIQVSGPEHFNRAVHPWSCTAVPFRDPDTGAVIGVLDITGTEMAVAPHTLSLVEAAVAAAQAQLRVERLLLAAAKRDRLARRRKPASAALPRDAFPEQHLSGASIAIACSCSAATMRCSVSKEKRYRCPHGTVKCWPS